MATDVEQEVVKYSAPIVFETEAAGNFEKFLAQDGFVAAGIDERDPHGAGLAARIKGFHDEEEGETVGLGRVDSAHILADLFVRAYGLDADVVAQDVSDFHGLVGFGDPREVVAHDGLAEAHADVVLLLVGNDELVPLVQAGAECVLRQVEPLA